MFLQVFVDGSFNFSIANAVQISALGLKVFIIIGICPGISRNAGQVE
jgi:hypothetical protein